jgi:hypothetical protein
MRTSLPTAIRHIKPRPVAAVFNDQSSLLCTENADNTVMSHMNELVSVTPTDRPCCTRRSILLGIAMVAAFVITHNIAPLYTSNQNTKYVIGMAQAGVGSLDEDYLAHCTDPFPLFTGSVYLTHAFLTPAMFYVYAALLMGLYVYGMFGIAHALVQNFGATARWVFAALLLLAHAAILRWPIRDALGRDLIGLAQDGWAGQYILGPIFQPSMFGVLLLCAVRWFLEKRWLICIVSIAAAAAMHPSYVLISIMLIIALTVSLLVQRRWGLAALVLVGGLALTLPMVIYLSQQFAKTDPDTYAAAQKILSEERIPHHMVIAKFFKGMAVTQVVWVAAAIWLARKSRLALPLAIVFGLAIVMTVVAGAGSGETATRVREIQPWRATAWAIPVATAVVLAFVASRLAARLDRTWLRGVCLAVILLCVAGGLVMQVRIVNAEKQIPYWGVMQYVREHRKKGDLYVVPADSKSSALFMKFRLHTQAATYATFKSHPNKDNEVLEWYRRFQNAESFYKAPTLAAREAALDALLADRPTHIVVPAEMTLDRPGFKRVWADARYALYQVRENEL